jgi:hypothetical protein
MFKGLVPNPKKKGSRKFILLFVILLTVPFILLYQATSLYLINIGYPYIETHTNI